MKKVMWTMAAVLLMSAPAFADGVAGKWSGETQGRNGPRQITLDLQTSGANLSGTMTSGDNPPVDIEQGTVSGGTVSFMTTRSIQGFDLKIKWSGEAKGDELTLTREITNLPAGAPTGNGSPPPVTLQRTK